MNNLLNKGWSYETRMGELKDRASNLENREREVQPVHQLYQQMQQDPQMAQRVWAASQQTTQQPEQDYSDPQITSLQSELAEEGGDICIHIGNSLHCTAETNNIVKQLYSINKKE